MLPSRTAHKINGPVACASEQTSRQQKFHFDGYRIDYRFVAVCMVGYGCMKVEAQEMEVTH